MNALNIKLTIIAAAVLLVCSPLLHGSVGTRSVQHGSTQTVAELFDDSRRVYGKEVIVTWSEANDETPWIQSQNGRLGRHQDRTAKGDCSDRFTTHGGGPNRGFQSLPSAAKNGRWDVIELSRDSKAQPIIGDSLVQIEDNGHLYTFAAEKARGHHRQIRTLRASDRRTMELEIREFESSMIITAN